VEQNGQGGDVNSSQTSAVTGKMDDNEPDPVASSDATPTPNEDTSHESQKAEQGELLVRFPEISAQHIYQHEWIGMSFIIVYLFSDCADTCDLYRGEWVTDSSGPLYTNNSCPIITQMQNCQGNGRPDKDYENWRWKPEQCNLPRFDARKFLELMRGKTLAFVGDSVARNQMESLLCILWQVRYLLLLFRILHLHYSVIMIKP